MGRNVIGIVVALVLAAVGTVVLVGYVGTAEERARAGEELVEVYVVTSRIPTGTAGGDIEGLVRVEQVPAKVRAEGHVDNLAAITDLVAAVDLVPGEQLLANRFVPRADLVNRPVGVVVPDDAIELTLSLAPHRVIGGLLEPGDTVAVFASFEPFEIEPAAGEETTVVIDGEELPLTTEELPSKTPKTTDLLLRKVLVTAVQYDIANQTTDRERDTLTEAPTNNVLVTLALRPADAERLVFSSEFGLVWLGIERSTVPEDPDPIQTRGSVYLEPATAGSGTPLASTGVGS
jgi:pilus assembly protein CpaB